jgi:hypothetical protein
MNTRIHTRRPRNRSRFNAEFRARVIDAILGFLATVLIALMFAWVAVNWVTGCGETFVTYTGAVIEGECVLMPWRD